MKIYLSCWFFLIGFCSFAQPVKRLYLANDDHTDFMWTADEAAYDSAFVHMLDYHLAQVQATRGNAPDFQARFNCDGSYWLRAYQKYRSPAQFSKLIDAVRSGHIGSPLNTLVSTYGAQPTEAVIRGMYYAGQLERAYKLRFPLAEAMENNTIPLGLSSLWAGSGAKYSWKGIGGYGSQMSYERRENRRHPLYHYRGLDSSGVLMKWYSFRERNGGGPFGGYAECRLVIKSTDTLNNLKRLISRLDLFCDTISSNSQYPYNVAGAFGWGHDDLDNFMSQPIVEAARSETVPGRKVRISNEQDFFEDVARSYPVLPSESVSYGNEWDLYCASMNETTAKVRRATEKLRTAEALASIVSLKKPMFLNDLTTARNLAWESFGMYWEHNWTADGPVKRPLRAAWQEKIQRQISDYTDSLFSLSAMGLAFQIKKGMNPRFYVFNALSWKRDDIADIKYDGSQPVSVFDLTDHKEVACQFIKKGKETYLRIYAEKIPPVGYKVFEIRRQPPAAAPLAAKMESGIISGKKYSINLSPSGAITGIWDKTAGNRQLVKAIDGKYVNDLGARLLTDGQSVEVENEGPVSVTFKAVSNVPLPHTVRVTLFAHKDRIEIEDSIQANFNDVKSWSFSFDLKNQITRHEELGAILTAKSETRGGHYAAQNARLDWQTFNHFADMSEQNYGITLSNMDCSFFKLGKSSVDSLWEQSSQLNALAGGQVDAKVEDKGLMGIFSQNGQTGFLYKFAMATHHHAFDATASMKFSLEHQNPLVTGLISGTKNGYPATHFSLLKISDPNVLLWSLKPSEEGIGEGLIARFWNMNGKKSDSSLSLAVPVKSAWKTTHIETNLESLKPLSSVLNMHFAPNQIGSYRIKPNN